MKLERTFGDLGDFVAAYRGAISREGMLHVADSHWPLGTTLKVDLRLDDGLSLVRGLGTVIRIQLMSDGEPGWLVALKFLDLDPASRDLLDRLEIRNQGEGVPPFRLSDPTLRPPSRTARPAHRSTPPPRATPMSFDFTVAPPATEAALDVVPEQEPTFELDDEYAPEHEPHPALLEEAPALTPEATVPLGLSVEPEPMPEPLPPAQPLRGSEATLPMEDGEPATLDASSHDEPGATGFDSGDSDHPPRTRLLLWVAALAAVAVIAVTLTWLLVPELFSGRDVADATAIGPSGTGDDRLESALQAGGSAVEPPEQRSGTALAPTVSPTEAPEPAPTVPTKAPPTVAPTPLPTAAPPPTVAASVSASPLRVLSADWNEDSGGTTIVITASRPVDPGRVRAGRLDAGPGPRELFRLLDVASSALAVQTAVGGRDLTAIRTWLHDDRRPPELHVVLDLADPGVTAAPPEVAGPTIAIRLRRAGS